MRKADQSVLDRLHEQQDHIERVRGMVECESCGQEAIHYLITDNLGYPNKIPLCGDCTQEHEHLAQDTNEHEMRNFGGAYGLVAYHYEPLETAQPDHIPNASKMLTPLAHRKIQSKLAEGYRKIENATVLVNEHGRAAIVNHGGAFYWVENSALAREYDGRPIPVNSCRPTETNKKGANE